MQQAFHHQTALTDQRPTSILVIAVLSIVLGALGCICTPFIPAELLMQADTDTARHLASLQWYAVLLIVNALVSAVISIMLIASGIGLLNRRPWGRTMSIWYAWLTIVFTLIFTPPYIYAHLPMISVGDIDSRMEAWTGIVGGVVGLVISLSYPIVVLYFMARTQTKQWLAKQA